MACRHEREQHLFLLRLSDDSFLLLECTREEQGERKQEKILEGDRLELLQRRRRLLEMH